MKRAFETGLTVIAASALSRIAVAILASLWAPLTLTIFADSRIAPLQSATVG